MSLPDFARGWALFLDVDGTLVELAEHPNAVRVEPALIEALYKIKDSYNVDRLTQVAGVAALRVFDAAAENNRQLASRRDRLAAQLRERFGWRVWPSAANFLLADTSPHPAREVYEGLKAQRVLVRYFARPRLDTCLRITIGSESEVAVLLSALERLRSGLLR